MLKLDKLGRSGVHFAQLFKMEPFFRLVYYSDRFTVGFDRALALLTAMFRENVSYKYLRVIYRRSDVVERGRVDV